MSLYIFMFDQDTAFIGADTRESTEIDNSHYRLNDNAKKIHKVGNKIITLGGVHDVCQEIIEQYRAINEKNQTIEKLKEIIIVNQSKIKKRNKYELEICCITYENGKNRFYNIASYNDYNIKMIESTKDNITKTYGGICVKEAQEYIRRTQNQYKKNINDIINLYFNTYKYLSSEVIGGTLNLYVMNKGKLLRYLDLPIQDSRKINDLPFSLKSIIPYNVCSENLLIQNSSGTFEANKDGVTITDLDLTITRSDGKSAILLNPTDGIKIQGDLDGLGLTDNFYVGIDGRIKAKGIDIDGTGTFSGTVSAGTITGSTFTGGLIRTAETGKRIEIDSNGLISYDEDDLKEGISIELGEYGFSELKYYQNNIEVGSLLYDSLGGMRLFASSDAHLYISDAIAEGVWNFTDKIVISDGTEDINYPDRKKGNIENDGSGLLFKYIKSDGETVSIHLGEEGLKLPINIDGENLEAINFYNNGFSATYDGNEFSYTWTKDENGKITSLITEDNVVIPITWNSSDM